VAEARRRLDVLAAHDRYRQRQWFHIEDVCVAALAAGGTFKAWRLAPASRCSGSTPTSTTLIVPRADGHAAARFSTTADMAAMATEFAHRATAPARLLRPDRFNVPAIDSVLLVRGDSGRVEATVLNVTVSPSHTLRVDRANGLAALARTQHRALNPPIPPAPPIRVAGAPRGGGGRRRQGVGRGVGEGDGRGREADARREGRERGEVGGGGG